MTGNPTLSRSSDRVLQGVVDGLGDAADDLASTAGDRSRITRLASDLSTTLDRLHAQEASTRATVLVVLLLAVALATAAALLAGWLVAAVRADERDLLVAMGLSRSQRVTAAASEALLLSAVATVLAVPAAAVVHAGLTRLPDLTAAGLSQGPTPTWSLLAAVVATAVLLTATLVATTLGPTPESGPGTRRGLVARLGVGPLLLVGAALAWWQLRSQVPSSADTGDVTLTLAPVLAVAALTVLCVRLVPLLLGRAASVGARSRGLAWSLSTQQAARRPHSGTAMVLVAGAVAAAVFALALRSTWLQSQTDQADLRVGTDLSLSLAAAAGPDEAAQVEQATAGSPASSPVVHRPLSLGRFVGGPDARPALVALDTRRAGALLRGRAGDGRDWSAVTADLAPGTAVAGVRLVDDGTTLLRGDGPPGTALTVVPTAVVEDASGVRSSVPAGSLPLDGAAHRVRWLGPLGDGLRLVGLRLELDGYAGEEPPSSRTAIAVVLDLPGTTAQAGPPWRLQPLQQQSPVAGAEAALRTTAGGAELTATFGLDLEYFSYTGADLLATAFPATGSVPVVASQALVDAVGARPGDELSAVVGDTELTVEVRRVVPTIPSAPGQVAVLADADALTRALLDAGRLDPLVDSWWVARPPPATVDALQALGLGDVTTRHQVEQQLSRGPLRVAVPAALAALVALAVTLLLAGTWLVLGAERQRRTAEVVRLRALGLSRLEARHLLLAEHVAFFVPTIAMGALVGLVATLLLGPHLVRSDLGTAPVPVPVVAWPWTAEVLLVGAVVIATVILAAALGARHVRASDPSRLRGVR